MHAGRRLRFLLQICLALLAVQVHAQAAVGDASFAFFYGANPPWDALRAFDTVVVEPDHAGPIPRQGLGQTRVAAYVSVGEVQPSRRYAARIPASWLIGENAAWGSRIIDQSQPQWPAFFASEVIAPLWEQGYRDFFLDTLDSFSVVARTEQQRQQQIQGLVAVVQTIKQRYPEARLIFNRGFEILPQTHAWASAVVAESLFRRYEAARATYSEVPLADRQWLTGQLQQVQQQWKLPVVVIDYVPLADRALARQTAGQIAALGFTPWVSTGDLGTVGVGAVEVMPRRILVVHDVAPDERAQALLEPVRVLGAPFSYLGYVPEFVDIRHLPSEPLVGQYAGVVVWGVADRSPAALERLRGWLQQQHEHHVPVALMACPPELLNASAGERFGLTFDSYVARRDAVRIVQQDPIMGFERTVRPLVDDFFPMSVREGRPLLTLQQGDATQVAVAITPWGGYAVGGYGVSTLPADAGERWMLDPFAFFTQALQLPVMPVPDVTTETGRRMLMVHMDGDGFISRAELPQAPIAGEVIRDRVVQRYRIPMTISVIEAEVSSTGLYPGMATLAQGVAREIFRQPHVAVASHSYSHPFYWSKVGDTSNPNGGYNLRIPGYQFDLQREVQGSIDFINTQLAPAGKPVELFLWTGDCLPVGDAVERTVQAQVLNMNGGGAVTTRANASLTRVDGLGLQRKGGFQVYAPNQNENVYTNNWLGPFYGFERVIETFELTNTPRRLKPMDIYFHTYIATKKAGLQSLDKVFAYALSQEHTPVHVSEYLRKVLDFQTMSIARTPQGWQVRGDGALRTLRLPSALGRPQLSASAQVAGFREEADFAYVHLAGSDARLQLGAQTPAVPVLVSANARVERLDTVARGQRWTLQGHVPLAFAIDHSAACEVRWGDRVLHPVRRAGTLHHYEVPDHVAGTFDAICRS